MSKTLKKNYSNRTRNSDPLFFSYDEKYKCLSIRHNKNKICTVQIYLYLGCSMLSHFPFPLQQHFLLKTINQTNMPTWYYRAPTPYWNTQEHSFLDHANVFLSHLWFVEDSSSQTLQREMLILCWFWSCFHHLSDSCPTVIDVPYKIQLAFLYC